MHNDLHNHRFDILQMCAHQETVDPKKNVFTRTTIGNVCVRVDTRKLSKLAKVCFYRTYCNSEVCLPAASILLSRSSD